MKELLTEEMEKDLNDLKKPDKYNNNINIEINKYNEYIIRKIRNTKKPVVNEKLIQHN